ncbi:hypothetical protein GCM10027058_31450 [Microbacterium neimengense]
MSSEREQAWAAVHDPATDAAALADIARRHPEFAAAIGAHPNCYPELAAWAREAAAVQVQSLSEAHAQPHIVPVASPVQAPRSSASRMPGADAAPTAAPASRPELPGAHPAAPRRGLSKTAWWIAAAGSGVVLVACGAWAVVAFAGSPGAQTDSAVDVPASAPTPAGERTLAGPPVYVGDELAWLTLDDDSIRTLFTGVDQIERDAVFGGIGEREGAMTDPAICDPWAFDAQWAIVGLRSAAWGSGRASTLQFPTGVEAEEYFASYADSAAPCAQYTSGMFGSDPSATPYSSTTVEVMSQDDASLAARVVESGDYGGDRLVALRLEGNVVLSVAVDIASLSDASGSGVNNALADAAEAARARLTDEIGYR